MIWTHIKKPFCDKSLTNGSRSNLTTWALFKLPSHHYHQLFIYLFIFYIDWLAKFHKYFYFSRIQNIDLSLLVVGFYGISAFDSY